MSNSAACFVFFAIFMLLVFLQIAIRSKNPIKKALTWSFWGIIALTIVNITSSLTSASLPVSLLSVGVSAVMGIPGVTMLLILNMVLR
ncbi:MAG: pro-sigmaK processing inhibitor BofA family protein [Oscillospiraceae bacterium]|jgi:pro-sigmaK processing inhibitor BofA|nr:pro-sigmaK processing inhibitor BofA family protein [Oscillospiraceae bacterium]